MTDLSTPARGPRVLWGIAIVLGWLLVAVGAVFAAASLWVRRTFGRVSVDQLVMNVQGGGDQGGGGDVVTRGLWWGLVAPLVVVLVLAVSAEIARRAIRRRRARRGAAPRLSGWARAAAIACAVAVPLAGSASLSSTIGAADYIDSYVQEAVTGTTLGDFYVTPELRAAAQGAAGTVSTETAGPGEPGPGDEPRNLIVIYLESIEDALADDTVFEKNMLAPVQEATQGWQTIPQLTQYEGGGWTMAGIVSTQCGVPLRSVGATVDITEMNLIGSQGKAIDAYLPGAVCLGDVLKDRGYRNVFLGGANADFAGKGTFLGGHGYNEVRDLKTWQMEGETELRPDWGLSDRRLFELAAETVTVLHEAGQPFNLTMLSLDTHELPHAHPYCEVDTEAPLTAITLCSMQQVATFIDYLEEQGYLEDTAVMVMGDHAKFIAESNSYFGELSALDTHTIFNRVWLPEGAGLTVGRDAVDQLSVYATLLEMAGIDVPDHRAGVGVSAFAAEPPQGSLPSLSAAEYDNIVKSRSSEFYRELWGGAPEVVEAEAQPTPEQ